MGITVTPNQIQREGGNGSNQAQFSSKQEHRAGHFPEMLFCLSTENTHYISPLTDGDKAAGPTAMLPKLCQDCLTIKISKEITVAYWQLFQLFAPVSLVLHMCLEWITLTRAGHISPFHKWFTPEPSSPGLPGDGNLHEECATASCGISLLSALTIVGSVAMFTLACVL